MSNGIDVSVVLGIAGKTVEVFKNFDPSAFLSFPLTPVPIKKAGLQALLTDPFSPLGEQALAEFSHLVNELPSGSLWQPKGIKLWDIYGDVVAGIELADIPRTAAEEVDYQRAFDLLYDTGPNDVVMDSGVVTSYEQYRDAYITLVQEYNNRKGQALLSNDPEVKAKWDVDEPSLREKIEKALLNWNAGGKRAEVENARRLLADMSSRSPLMAWAGYRKLFDPDIPEIFFRTSIDNVMYVPTAYMPSDIMDSLWPSITVKRSELSSLASAAPEELRSRLSVGTTNSSITSVSFEYSSVNIRRPWFAPEALLSRAWRFYQPNRILCDGGTPPKGECTAYVSGLVLARNMVITGAPIETLTTPSNLMFLPASSTVKPLGLVNPQRGEAIRARAADRRAVVEHAGGSRTILTLSRPRLAERAHTPTMLRGRVDAGTIHSGIRGPIMRDPIMRDPIMRDPIIRDPIVRDPIIPRIPGKRLPMEPRPLPLPRPTDPLPSPPGGMSTSERIVKTEPDDIFVMAFICSRLPKVPNPDPGLNWD
jgi:hypothetical protein